MKIQIGKSVITDQHRFDQAIAAYQAELKDWTAHNAKVESDFLNDKVKAKDKHHPYPPPTTSDLVALAAANGYEIIDDGPTPEQKLATRKQELLLQVYDAQKVAAEKIITPAKMQLHDLRSLDIGNEDNRRIKTVIAKRKRFIEAAKSFVGIPSTDPIEEALAMRPADDEDFMKQHAKHRDKLQAIHRTAAQALADIEDLTPQTVGSFKVPEFT